MKNLDYCEYYRRNLPHYQPPGATFLVNFHLAGSLPADVIERLKAETENLEKRLLNISDPNERFKVRELEQSKLFGKWEDALHSVKNFPFYLREDDITDVVANSIRYHDGEWFDVVAFCIMPNHVHLVLTPYRKSDEADYG